MSVSVFTTGTGALDQDRSRLASQHANFNRYFGNTSHHNVKSSSKEDLSIRRLTFSYKMLSYRPFKGAILHVKGLES